MTERNPKDALTPVELEAGLLRQEHRLFSILLNWFTRKNYSDGDPRRVACTHALLWRLVLALTPALAITGGGAVGIGGLWLAYQANELLREQTEIIATDAQAALRFRLIETLYQHAEPRQASEQERDRSLPSADLGVAAYSHRARAEALDAFVALERRRQKNVATPHVNVAYALLDHVDASGFNLRGIDLKAADLTASHLVEADLSECNLEQAKIVGALLTDTNLRGSDLAKANLSMSVLSNADLSQVDLSEGILHGAMLKNVDLTGANLHGAILIDTVLDGCRLDDTVFDGAVVLQSDVSTRDATAVMTLLRDNGWKLVTEESPDGIKITYVMGRG